MTARRLAAFVSTLAALAIGSIDVASGQTARDPVLAESLFNRGKELLQAGDWTGACEKFQSSMDLDPSVSTLLKIAKCREHGGKLALAWYDYHRALKLNRERTDQSEQRRKDLEDYARSALAALEPRVPRLRISIASSTAGTVVTRNGQPLPLTALGEPLLVDPGPQDIVVERPGRPLARKSAIAVEGAVVEVAFLDEPAPAAFPPGGGVPAPAAPTPAPAPKPDAAVAGRGQRIAAIAVGGVGVVSLGIAGVLALQTRSKVSDSEQFCNGGSCTDQRGIDLLTSAGDTQTAAIVFLAVGAAATGAGVALWLTAPTNKKRADHRDSAHVAVGVGAGAAFARARW